MDETVFADRMAWMVERLKSNKLRPGADEILIPGERSARAAAKNERNGIAIGPETVVELERWCKHFGISFDGDGTGGIDG
jgi:LDH2 family malate/lactate/ureidoglycolate dehydrogenase